MSNIPEAVNPVDPAAPRRRVILLSYRFPTVSGSMVASRRAEALYRYLPEFGWDPLVITAAGGTELPRVIGVPDHSYVGLAERAGAARSVPRKQRGFAATVRTGLKYAARLHPRYFDGYAAWSIAAAKQAEQLGREQRFDAIWATLSPQSLARPTLRAAHRLYLPVVLDLRDPIEEDFPGPRPGLAHALGQARAVTLAAPLCDTPLVQATQRQRLLVLSGTWHTEPQVPDPTPQFRIVFAGTWHQQFDAAPLLQAFAELQGLPDFTSRARLVFIGRHNQLLRSTIGFETVAPQVELHELVPYEQAQAEIRGASVLLLFRAAEFKASAISGKIFDYAAHELPLLSIGGVPGLHGGLVEWLGKHCLWTLTTSEIANFLRLQYERWRRNGSTRVTRNPVALGYLSQRRVAAETAEVLNAVVEQRPVRLRDQAPWGQGLEALP